MKLFPVALNLQDKRCLVVGGGAVAQRKVQTLLDCGARVAVIAPALCEDFAPCEQIEWQARRFQAGDSGEFDLVFACTDERAVNAAVAREAQQQKIWCNVADDAPGSDFHAAATLRRGDICIGITTGGGSPALAKHLKSCLTECIGPQYEQLLELMRTRRAASLVEEQAQRAELWRAILASEALSLLKDGRRAQAEKLIDELIEAAVNPRSLAPDP